MRLWNELEIARAKPLPLAFGRRSYFYRNRLGVQFIKGGKRNHRTVEDYGDIALLRSLGGLPREDGKHFGVFVDKKIL